MLKSGIVLHLASNHHQPGKKNAMYIEGYDWVTQKTFQLFCTRYCECSGSLTVKSRCKCKSRNIMENQIADSHYLPFVKIYANALLCKQELNYSISGLTET